MTLQKSPKFQKNTSKYCLAKIANIAKTTKIAKISDIAKLPILGKGK